MENFSARRGDDLLIQLEFENPDETAYDVTDFELTMKLKRFRDQVDENGDEDVDLEVTGVLDSADEGLGSFTITGAESADLDGTYFYDMFWIDADDKQRVFASGVITFARSGSFDSPVLSVTVGETSETTVSNNATARDTFKIEKFSRTPASGYTTLTANQLSGAAVIPTVYTFRTDSLLMFRNGIPMERGVEFSEHAARTSITLIGTYDDADKFEVRYVKN